VARWVEAAKPVQAGWMIDMHKRGIDGRALFEDAQAMLAKYEVPVAKTMAKPVAKPAAKTVVSKPAKP
jgi:hypothetical protein